MAAAQANPADAPARPTVTDDAQAKAAKRDRSSDVVYVGCKFPNGVVLDLDQYEPINDKGDVRLKKGKLPPVKLRGYAHMIGIEAPLVSPGGYVLTPVPAEFWAEWIERNAEGDLIASGMIYAETSHERATRRGEDQAAAPRVFRGMTPSKADGVEVATDDRGKPLLESAAKLQ